MLTSFGKVELLPSKTAWKLRELVLDAYLASLGWANGVVDRPFPRICFLGYISNWGGGGFLGSFDIAGTLQASEINDALKHSISLH